MCGIAGILWTDPQRVDGRTQVGRALDAIIHRGPDGEGRLISPGIAAGMRRLAIIDLAGGNQPIFNEDGTIGVLFNGEIYNFRELRAGLIAARPRLFDTGNDAYGSPSAPV